VKKNFSKNFLENEKFYFAGQKGIPFHGQKGTLLNK